ncbi:DinB family protein [Salinimicrobium catena]|uniref:DinB family protein n=1 Tax=Salinimicrobium catena TaxID=390640 RepID=UPI002FE4870C
MENQEAKKNPGFLDYVYKLNADNDLEQALELSLKGIKELDVPQLKKVGLQIYDSNKWTVNKIFQHLIDWERIWCYRAILFARNEGHIPEALDQEIMADNCNADERTIEELIEELYILRRSTIAMFRSFNEKILNKDCVFFEYEMPLYSIGLTITAHQIHHFEIIKERYLPLRK